MPTMKEAVTVVVLSLLVTIATNYAASRNAKAAKLLGYKVAA